MGGGGRPRCPSSGVCTSQARLRHEARHLSLCRGGGLPCGSRHRPSYPAFAPPVPPPLGLARRVLPTGTVVWSVPHPLSAASPPCRFVLGGGGRCPPLPTFTPHPWGGGGVCVGGGGGGLSSSLRCTHVAGTTLARRRHEARHLSLCRGGGMPCGSRRRPSYPAFAPPVVPPLGLARRVLSSGTVVWSVPHPLAAASPPCRFVLGGGGGALLAPPYLHPPPSGGRRCVGGGGAPLSSSLRSTHVAGTTQARRRHEARHLSLCRGGGPAVCHPSSPLLPCVRTPGGAEVCGGGGGGALVVVPSLHTCRRHDASTTQARGAALGCSGGGGVLLWAFQPSSTVGAPHPRISSRRCPLAVVARTRTAHDTTHGNYPLPCPLCSLPRPQCSHGAEQCPCLPRRSLSLLRLSGLRSPPKCPTSFALPVPSSLVHAGPRCLSLRRHTAHCTFGGGLPCGSTPRHPALP